MPGMTLISLTGAVSLLVWGLYMVKTGILRTFGDNLRTWLSTRLNNRFEGFAAGFGLASLLQSSTASSLLIAGLQNKGLVSTAIALSCVLGADLGSAFIVRVLSLDLSALVPILTIAGVFLFSRRPDTRLGQFGRILLGLAFVMMSLRLIVETTAPIKESGEMLEIFASIGASATLSSLIGAVLALLCFSSLAVVTVASGMAASGVLSVEAGLWVVLGANFGSALLSCLTTLNSSRIARRAPVGNFVFRSTGFVAGVLLLVSFPEIKFFFSEMPDGLVNFHLVFNAVVGLAGLGFLHPVACFVEKRLPSKAVFPSTEVQLLFEENMLSSTTAIELSRQEIAKTTDFLLRFWERIEDLLTSNPPAGVLLSYHEDLKMLVRRCRSVERFLDVLIRRGLTAREARAWQGVNSANDGLSFSVNILSEIVSAIERRKCRDNCFFTPAGLAELKTQHDILGRELRLLARMLKDPKNTRRDHKALLLMIKKRDSDTFALVAQHMARVAKGEAGAVDTSTLHVDLLALFRRFEAAIASAAGDLV